MVQSDDEGQGAAKWMLGEGIAREVTNKFGRIVSKLNKSKEKSGSL